MVTYPRRLNVALSESYPYLSASREAGLSYAAALALADWMDGPPGAPPVRAEQDQYEIVREAWLREQERRGNIAPEQRTEALRPAFRYGADQC